MRLRASIAIFLGLAAAPVAFAPFLLALGGFEGFQQAGWAVMFFTVPIGLAFQVCSAVLSTINASCAIRNQRWPRLVPITGITLVTVGLVVEAAGLFEFVFTDGDSAITVAIAGLMLNIIGVLICGLVSFTR